MLEDKTTVVSTLMDQLLLIVMHSIAMRQLWAPRQNRREVVEVKEDEDGLFSALCLLLWRNGYRNRLVLMCNVFTRSWNLREARRICNSAVKGKSMFCTQPPPCCGHLLQTFQYRQHLHQHHHFARMKIALFSTPPKVPKQSGLSDTRTI